MTRVTASGHLVVTKVTGERHTGAVVRRPAPAGRSLAAQLFLLQVGVALLAVLAGGGLAYADARPDGTAAPAPGCWRSPTASPTRARSSRPRAPPGPVAALQPVAEAVRRNTGVDFVVVMSTPAPLLPPGPRLIGGQFVGTTAPAVAGQALTETFTGSLGPSVRAVVPVRDGRPGGRAGRRRGHRGAGAGAGRPRSCRPCSPPWPC